MSDIQPGKALERLVEMIQDHLKDRPEVQISRNIRLKSLSGKGREIDVFVQGKFDGQDIGIAFECKDHKREISVTDVEKFWAVLSKLPQVDKGVMVTTSGYTKEAKKEAETHKIGLFSIDDIPFEEIAPHHKLYGATFIFDPLIKALELHTKPDYKNATIASNTKLRYKATGEEVNILLEIYNTIYNSQILCELAASYMRKGQKPLIMVVRITPGDALYIEDVNGTKYEVEYFRVPIQMDLRLEECPVTAQKKYSPVAGGVEVSVSEYDSANDDNTWVVVESGDDKKSCYIKHNGIYYKPEIEISGQIKDTKS